MTKKIIIFILILLSTSLSTGKDTLNIIENTDWEILYDQTKSINMVMESKNWSQLHLPVMFKLPYRPIGDFQFAWLRSTFDINSNPGSYYGITIENPYHSIFIYINKKLAWKRSPRECSSIHNPIDIKLKNEILKQGKNEIYIHLGVYDNYHGGISDNIILHKRKNFINTNSINRFIYYEFTFGSVLFLLILVVFNGSLFIWDRKEKANLYAALLCLLSSLQIVLLFFPFINPGIIFRINTFYFIMFYIPIIYIYLIQALYNEFLHGLNKYLSIPFLVCSLYPLINGFINFTLPFSGFLSIIITLISLFLNVYIIYRLNSIKPDPVLFYFFTICCIIIPYLLWTIDIIKYFFIDYIPPKNSMLLLPIFMTILMILVIRKISHKHHKMKILYMQLKDSLNQDNKEKENKLQITRNNQKKLDSVISFINDNYKDDLSREGLASSVDLSPDHLSRLFNSYTGKRINNYINELRVKDAAQRLIETDLKVIDIAFTVGFESLTTFNRVFLDIIGKTPTKYRDENQ